jgi:hypothetical protein
MLSFTLNVLILQREKLTLNQRVQLLCFPETSIGKHMGSTWAAVLGTPRALKSGQGAYKARFEHLAPGVVCPSDRGVVR